MRRLSHSQTFCGSKITRFSFISVKFRIITICLSFSICFSLSCYCETIFNLNKIQNKTITRRSFHTFNIGILNDYLFITRQIFVSSTISTGNIIWISICKCFIKITTKIQTFIWKAFGKGKTRISVSFCKRISKAKESAKHLASVSVQGHGITSSTISAFLGKFNPFSAFFGKFNPLSAFLGKFNPFSAFLGKFNPFLSFPVNKS